MSEKIDTPKGVSKPEKERIPRIESKADFPDRESVRAEARSRVRALMLILLMIGILIGTVVLDEAGAAPESEPVSDATP